MKAPQDARSAAVAGSNTAAPPGVDFSALYDQHPEYVARRLADSYEQALVDIEVRLLKLPQLLAVVPPGLQLQRVAEIGCATGELIAAFPLLPGGYRLGIDISAANVAAASRRFPAVEFRCGDFRAMALPPFDAVVLSDVLEHVPDDVDFLRAASQFGRVVLLNLPLEDNWLNLRRAYGPDDVSGHLRKYGLADGLALVQRAGLQVLTHQRVWVHETPAEAARRALRRERFGQAYAGGAVLRRLRQGIFRAAAWPLLGRRLFASNLFVAARAATPSGADAGPGASP